MRHFEIERGAAAFLRREISALLPFVLVIGGLLRLALGSFYTARAYIGGR